MKTKLILFALLFSFAAVFAQDKAKLQKADESGFIEVDKLPALKTQLKPHYPEIARLAGIEGTVYLKILVGENGNVEKAKVEQGAKDMLDNSALEAAKDAKFFPAMLNGKPVKVWVILPVSFKLDVEKNEKVGAGDKEYPGINEMVKVEKLPEMIVSAKPFYPEQAKKAGIEGKVFVKLLVDKEGLPKKAVVIKSDNEIFNQSAIDAAMNSKFTPAINEGEKIAVWVVLPYKYSLASGKAKGETKSFGSPENAKEYYNGFTSAYATSPVQQSGQEIKFEKIAEKISFGDESCLYKVTKDKKTLYNFVARLNNKIYKYAGASNIQEIQTYVDDLKKNVKAVENIPSFEWLITSKQSDYPSEALEKKLEGKVTLKVLLTSPDKNVKQVDVIKSPNEILKDAAKEYVKNNINMLLERYGHVRQVYFEQHPKGVKEPLEIKVAAIITIMYKIEE